VIALNCLTFHELALAGDGEGLVFDADIDVLEVDIRDVGFEDEFILGLKDVDGRGPGPVGVGFVEEAGEGVFETAKGVNQGIVVAERHWF
jgi:hypothetical protein